MNTCLIIEDDSSIKETLKIALELDGLFCHAVENMSQASSHLKEYKYDIILLDYLLKDGPSEIVLDEIRKLYPNDPPLILISAVPHIVEIGRKLGLAHCLQKPFSLETLMQCIDTVLNLRSAKNK